MKKHIWLILVFQLTLELSGVTQNSLWKPTSVRDVYFLEEGYLEKILLHTNKNTSLDIDLPAPGGEMVTFQITPSRAFKYNNELPAIQCYSGHQKDRSTVRIKLDYSVLGLHAFILGPGWSYHIFPNRKGDYNVIKKIERKYFACSALKGSIKKKNRNTITEIGGDLRIFKIALTASGEYTRFWGSFDNTFLALASTVNQLNAIFERDLGVQLQLISDTRFLIFQNPDFDPFTFDGNQNVQNQQVLNQTLNPEDYDLGHLLMAGDTIGNQGLAFVGSVCDDRTKGSAFSILSDPSNYQDIIDILAHEIGHQLGGNHTFSHCADLGGGPLPVEPGSGSTIMAYGGLSICEPDNFVSGSSDYFHSANIKEIGNFLQQESIVNCPEVIELNNQFPKIDLSDNAKVIPQSTPFELRAEVSNPDQDSLSFCWEQIDDQVQRPLGQIVEGSPMFRSFPPSTSPNRVIPPVVNLIQQLDDPALRLPDFSTDIRFRCTVRDNQPEGGSINWEEVTISVINNAGPFTVDIAQTAQEWVVDSEQEVFWEVAGTDRNPINVDRVDISLILDSLGQKEVILATNVRNNGRAVVIVPNLDQQTPAWIKIKARDNIFFALSQAPIFIQNPSTSTRENEFFSSQIQIFPNPASSRINIEGIPTSKEFYIELLDTFGKAIFVRRTQETSLQIPPEMGPGLYLIRIKMWEGTNQRIALKRIAVVE